MQNFGMTFAQKFFSPIGNSSAHPIPTPSSTCSLGVFSGLAGTYVSVLFTVLPLNKVWNPAEFCQHLSLPTQLLRWHSEFLPERCRRNFQERICAPRILLDSCQLLVVVLTTATKEASTKVIVAVLTKVVVAVLTTATEEASTKVVVAASTAAIW